MNFRNQNIFGKLETLLWNMFQCEIKTNCFADKSLNFEYFIHIIFLGIEHFENDEQWQVSSDSIIY